MSITNESLYSDKPLSLGRSGRHDPGELIVTRYSEEAIKFGRGLVSGANADGVKLPTSASDIFEGVAGYSSSALDIENDAYTDTDAVGVFQRGFPVVEVEEDVVPGNAVRVRHTEDKRAGSQAWGFSATTTAASASGLANDATAYTAVVTVDGAANNISIVGSASQTIQTVIDEINADLTGAVASFVAAGAALPDGTISTNGHILITSSTTGAASSISITDTDIFGTITNANAAADTAVAGSDDVDPLKEPGMFRTSAVAGQTALLTGCRWVSSSNGTRRAELQLTGQVVTMTADV